MQLQSLLLLIVPAVASAITWDQTKLGAPIVLGDAFCKAETGSLYKACVADKRYTAKMCTMKMPLTHCPINPLNAKPAAGHKISAELKDPLRLYQSRCMGVICPVRSVPPPTADLATARNSASTCLLLTARPHPRHNHPTRTTTRPQHATRSLTRTAQWRAAHLVP